MKKKKKKGQPKFSAIQFRALLKHIEDQKKYNLDLHKENISLMKATRSFIQQFQEFAVRYARRNNQLSWILSDIIHKCICDEDLSEVARKILEEEF